MTHYDAIVIGGGPGGYLAAERLGHAGKKVLLAEADTLGGTCLNVGCIPTKTLLNSAKLYSHALHGKNYGVTCAGVTFDWSAMQKWKGQVVKGLVGGIAAMEKRLGVEVVNAYAKLVKPGVVEIEGTQHTADHVIIATGSVPFIPPIPGVKDNPAVVDSTGLLAIEECPKRLAVIGGGVIGVEFASLFAALGSEVTVVEMLDEIIPFMDDSLSPVLRKGIDGVTFNLGCKVEKLDGGTVTFTTKKGETKTVEADTVLMAVGRRPALTGWGAEEAGLDVGRTGVIVDETMRTNLPNVWAIGDVTGQSLLAHAAYRMAEIATAHILDPAKAKATGQILRLDTIPWAVYSMPEAAGVGLTEATAKARGHQVVTSTVPMLMSGRFVAENGFRAPGQAKLIVDAETRRVLGCHIVGAYASEFIWGMSGVLEMELSVDDLRQIVFPHPTVCEVIREAAWALKD